MDGLQVRRKALIKGIEEAGWNSSHRILNRQGRNTILERQMTESLEEVKVKIKKLEEPVVERAEGPASKIVTQRRCRPHFLHLHGHCGCTCNGSHGP